MADGGVMEAALIGAAIGGGTSVVTGQDPLKGALLGGITGGAFSGIGGALGSAAPTATGTVASQTGAGLMSSIPGTTGASMLTDVATNTLPQVIPESLGGMSNIGLTQGANAGLGQVAQNATEQIATQIPNETLANLTNAGAGNGGIRNALNLKPGSMASNGLDWWDKQDTLTKAGLGGAGILGASALMAPAPVVEPIPKEKSKLAGYDRNTFTPYSPVQPQPYYRAQYAEGGIANLNNQYPQSQQFSNDYASSISPPMGNEVVNSGYEQNTNPYTGEPVGYNDGGIASLGGYAAGGNPQLLAGPGDGMSDSIPASIGNKQPARLAQGEFVVPADVVSHLGNGSTDAGAKHLYSMMDKVRKARTGNKKQGKQINPNKFVMA